MLESDTPSVLLPEKAIERKAEVNKFSDSFIKNAISGYIEFCYNYVVKERFESIEMLNQILLQIATNQRTASDNNKEIRELFSNYFKAKYTSSFFGLVPDSNSSNGESLDFKFVENYLNKLSPLKEDWVHLKKSIERLSDILPDNPIPFLLDAYTKLVSGEKDNNIIDEAFNQIARGFIKMRKLKSYKPENYQINIQSFLDQLYLHRPDLKEDYESIVMLRMHYIWLKDFNKKII